MDNPHNHVLPEEYMGSVPIFPQQYLSYGDLCFWVPSNPLTGKEELCNTMT